MEIREKERFDRRDQTSKERGVTFSVKKRKGEQMGGKKKKKHVIKK